jgi:hypothetical protein
MVQDTLPRVSWTSGNLSDYGVLPVEPLGAPPGAAPVAPPGAAPVAPAVVPVDPAVVPAPVSVPGVGVVGAVPVAPPVVAPVEGVVLSPPPHAVRDATSAKLAAARAIVCNFAIIDFDILLLICTQ